MNRAAVDLHLLELMLDVLAPAGWGERAVVRVVVVVGGVEFSAEIGIVDDAGVVFDLVEQLHGFNNAQRLAFLDRLAHFHKRSSAWAGSTVPEPAPAIAARDLHLPPIAT